MKTSERVSSALRTGAKLTFDGRDPTKTGPRSSSRRAVLLCHVGLGDDEAVVLPPGRPEAHGKHPATVARSKQEPTESQAVRTS